MTKRWSWINLRLASALTEWFRRRFTGAGRALLVTTLAAGVFGLDTRQTAASQAFALGAALLLVDRLTLLRPGPLLSGRRRLPRHAVAGQDCAYRVQVSHHGGRRACRLSIGERSQDPRPDLRTFLAARPPQERGLNPLQRLSGYPRWEWLVARYRAAAAVAPVELPRLSGTDACEVRMTLRPLRRGLVTLPALLAIRTGIFGLTRQERVIGGPERLLVMPRRWPVNLQRPQGRRRFQRGGLIEAGAGDGREFVGLRDYLPGDSPRHIHWAAWARSGEPVVKEYHDEYASRHALILDTVTAPDLSDHDAFECAVSIAASLIEPLSHDRTGPGTLLDLIFIAESPQALTQGAGQLSAGALLEQLACVGAQPGADFALLTEAATARAAALSSCVCVLLNWDASRRALVARLRRRGVAVRALVIDAPGDRPVQDANVNGTEAPTRVDPADPGPALAGLSA